MAVRAARNPQVHSVAVFGVAWALLAAFGSAVGLTPGEGPIVAGILASLLRA
jgi:hypothetical protein